MGLKSERSLSRQVIRLYARLRYGSRMAHAQDWLPYLTLTRASSELPGLVSYRQQQIATLLPATAFFDLVDDECTIVGSGPSIQEQQLEQLPPRSCLLLNGAVTLAPNRVAEPLAIAIEDERFVFRHFEMIRRHIDETTPCLLSVAAIRAIAERDALWLANRPVLLIDNLLKPYDDSRRAPTSPELEHLVARENDVAISTSPGDGVVQVGSVAISALQWTMATNVKTIGFAGVDISNADQPRFYESAGNEARSRLQLAQKNILAHAAIAAKLCKRRNVRIETYSESSALREVEIPYSDRLDGTSDASLSPSAR